jgi:hypothetical protein
MLMAELVFVPILADEGLGEPYQRLETPAGDDWALLYRTQDGYLIRFPDYADFRVDARMERVACTLHGQTEPENAQHLYRNQVWPLMQSHLGKLVFHASAVLVGQEAVAFVGMSGQGKSTLAAAFAISGLPFLADDGLVVSERGGQFWVESGLNSVRLWDDSVEALQTGLSQPAPGISMTSKARFIANADMPHQRGHYRLGHLFLLDQGAGRFMCEPMNATERLVAWLRHSFVLDVHDRQATARHFDGLSRLAMDVSASRLDYPRSYAALGEMRAFILRQLDSHEHASDK